MKTQMLVIATTLLLLGAQTTYAASCAGGEPDIQNPVPNCGVGMEVSVASHFQALDRRVHAGHGVSVERHGRSLFRDDE